MSTLYLLGVTLFFDALAPIANFAMAALLWGEYQRRKQGHLGWFAVIHAITGVTLAAMFSAQIAHNGGDPSDAIAFFRLASISVSVGSVLTLVVLADLYLARTMRVPVRVGAFLLGAAGIVTSVTSEAGIFLVQGYAVIEITSWSSALPALTVLFSAFALLFVTAPSSDITHSPDAPELLLSLAGLVSLLSFGTTFAAALTGTPFMLPVAAFLRVCVCIMALGAVAKGHPDARMTRDVFGFFRHSLILRSVGVPMLALWAASSLLLIGSGAAYLNDATRVHREAMRIAVDGLAQTHLAEADHQRHEADLIAERVRSGDSVAVGTMRRVSAEFLAQNKNKNLVVRAVAVSGDLVFSSAGVVDGTAYQPTRTVTDALKGQRTVGMVPVADGWVLRAVSPILSSSGSVLGAVIVDSPSGTVLPEVQGTQGVSAIQASGFGFVSPNGTVIASIGDALREDERIGTVAAYRDSGEARLTFADGEVLIAAVKDEYVDDGFFYAYTRQAEIVGYLADNLTGSVLIMLALLIIQFLVLSVPSARVLRVIRGVRAGMDAMLAGRHVTPIAIGPHDELGDLAEGFDRMALEMEDRTARVARVEEERDRFYDGNVQELQDIANRQRYVTDMLRYGDAGRLNAAQLKYVESLHDATQQMEGMITNLQDVASLDHKKYAMHRVTFAVEDVVDDVAGTLAVAARARSVRVQWSRPHVALPAAFADKDVTRKIVLGLVSNAIKYNVHGGTVTITVAEEQKIEPGGKTGAYLRMTVADTGRGIPAELQSRIFGKFYRAMASVPEAAAGSGLALHVAKRLAELQEGGMWFTSKEGVGTQFSLTVPQQRHVSSRDV